MEEKNLKNLKNFEIELNYSDVYKRIKNEIKDFVINRLLNKLSLQYEEIESIKSENEMLKKNLTFIIKKGLLEHYLEKYNYNQNKLNINTISNKKNFCNSSFFSPKYTENNNYLQTELNTLNESQIYKKNSIEKKANDLMYNILKKNNNKSKFLLTRNSSLYEGAYMTERSKKNLNHSCDSNFIMTETNLRKYTFNKNKILNGYHSQRDISTKKFGSKTSLDKINNKNISKDNSYRIGNSNEKKKNLKTNSFIPFKKDTLDSKKIDKRTLKNRSPFLKNKI